MDGNLYALAYGGNQNKVQYSRHTDYLKTVDRRNQVITPNSVENSSVDAYFSMQGTPTNQWYSVLTLKGWSNDYGVWQLAGPSSTNNTNSRPYYRDGRITTWNAWKPIAFLEDITTIGRDNFVIKTGDTMTGTLTISADAINPPSLSANPKLQFTDANGSQPVALVYTDFDAYRPPAGIRLIGNQGGEWFEAPWIICDRYNANTISSWTSDGGSFTANYFGNGTILNNRSSSVTGTIKIRLPVTWTNTMGVYKIMLYEYNDRGSSEITVSFYNYSSGQSYYNYSYQVNGGFEGAVRIAHDGSKCCILLGDTSYTWNYPKVYVHQIFGGQSISANYFDTNFNISIITSEAGLSRVTSVPKTSMNRHDANYIRALNKNGYYGMAIVGNSDNVYIRAPRLGIIPYSSGNPGEGMLGTEGWQFSHIYVNQTKTQRVSSVTNDLHIGSSNNAGWVYCQDLCSANGADEAYWSIRTNGNATFTNLTSKNKITGDISGSAAYLPIAYIGGTQANPQTYFNNGIGIKVAMTGVNPDSYWGDTLWINGYSGTDVPDTCALHFSRSGNPLIYISSQKYHATSYGTLYHVWTGYNSNHSSADWSCKTLNARDQVLAGSYIQALGGVNCAGVINSGGCSGFNVYATFHGNGDHGGIEIAASDNVLGIGVHKNDAWYMWWTPQGSVGNSSLKSYIFEWGANNWRFTGNILATGGITAKTTSDMRLKNKIGNSNYIEKILSLGPVFDYTYNDIAKSRVGKMVDNEIHIGLSYQDVSKLFPTMCGVDEDGYGYINYISPDLISLSIGAIQEIILEERKIKEDIIILKSKIHHLESENILLKKRLGLIP